MSDEDKTFELCCQLHKQYAEADNNKHKNLLSFIAAVGFSFTLYGYVFENYYLKDTRIDLLVATTFLVSILLFAIYSVSIIYGFTQRRDQVVIQRIRKCYFRKNYNVVFNKLFDSTNKNFFNFIPDYYLFISLVTFFLQLGLFIFCHFSLCCIKINECKNYCFTTYFIIEKLIFLFYLFIYVYYFYKYDKIKKDDENKSI